MNDCQNVAVREALPDLVHGALPDSERKRVLIHLDDCDDCAGELAIIRAVIAITVTPAIDVAAISAAIPVYANGASGGSRLHQGRFHVAHLRLAAALLVGAAGVSALVVEHQRGAVSDPVTVAAAQGNGVALVGTADLSDDNLAQLIQSMGQIDAAPPAEPDPAIPAVFDGDAS